MGVRAMASDAWTVPGPGGCGGVRAEPAFLTGEPSTPAVAPSTCLHERRVQRDVPASALVVPTLSCPVTTAPAGTPPVQDVPRARPLLALRAWVGSEIHYRAFLAHHVTTSGREAVPREGLEPPTWTIMSRLL